MRSTTGRLLRGSIQLARLGPDQFEARRITWFKILTPLMFVLLTALPSPAAVIDIQPAESSFNPNDKDTFLYQGFVGTPSDAFFNFGNLGDQTPYKGILGVSKTTTAPAIHNTLSLLEFDLGDLSSYSSSDVLSATLALQSTPGLGFYEDPSSSWPVTIDAFAITSVWTESGVTWVTQPTIGASSDGSQVVNSTSGAVSFDITQLVKDWMTGAVANNGLELVQRVEVKDTDSGRRVGATFFASSAGEPTYAGAASDRPLLQVVTVPEPSTWLLMAFGSGIVIAVKYRRKMS